MNNKNSTQHLSVAILLCTYNGENFLKSQLDSLQLQTHKNFALYISDDHSNDRTKEIISSYQENNPIQLIQIFQGPGLGFSKNFMSLVTNQNINADFYAFCDQDDYWLPNKITVALEKLIEHNQENPLLYCSRTTYVDDSLHPLNQYSMTIKKEIGFSNALIQSIAGGNTMVFNHSLRELLKLPSTYSIPSHDWWAYMVASSTGGKVLYDPHSYILYRQHNKALVGGNKGLSPKLNRIKNLAKNKFRVWTNQNIQCLDFIQKNMKTESVKIFEEFKEIRKENCLNKIKSIYKLKIYRQSKLETLLIKLAIIFNKV
jgi:glycosyltransferase involved in cell wall biosynthesis